MRGLTPTELLAWKSPAQEYVISNSILLAEGTLGIYGAEGVWKSMIAMGMMFNISKGDNWFGFKTWPSPVYYYETEIPQAPLQKRTYKYMIGNTTVTDNCWLCAELYNKIDQGYGYTELEKELERTNPKVLIIDPLNTSVSPKAVNDDYEAGLAIDRLNMLRKKFHLAIVIIHHNRKGEHSEGQLFHYGSDEWGGSGRWKKWLDSVIYVELLNDADPLVDLRLTFEKNPRHAENKILPIEIQANRLDLTLKRKIAGGIL